VSTILPTHTCFDDALDIIEANVRESPSLAHTDELILAHGILLHPDTGEPFAHAWVECSGWVGQAGFLNGEKGVYGLPWENFAERMRPQDVTRYTVRQALEENNRSGHYGPWLEKYDALCRNPKGVDRITLTERGGGA
jgi:hypothetical protein